MEKDMPIIHVVPAQPGFFEVYDLPEDREVILGDPVLAWRVETFVDETGQFVSSGVCPLTADGEMGANCIGVQNPDGSVTEFESGRHRSMKWLQSARYPDNARADTTGFVGARKADQSGVEHGAHEDNS